MYFNFNKIVLNDKREVSDLPESSINNNGDNYDEIEKLHDLLSVPVAQLVKATMEI